MALLPRENRASFERVFGEICVIVLRSNETFIGDFAAMIYLDYNATTPMDPGVLQEMRGIVSG